MVGVTFSLSLHKAACWSQNPHAPSHLTQMLIIGTQMHHCWDMHTACDTDRSHTLSITHSLQTWWSEAWGFKANMCIGCKYNHFYLFEISLPLVSYHHVLHFQLRYRLRKRHHFFSLWFQWQACSVLSICEPKVVISLYFEQFNFFNSFRTVSGKHIIKMVTILPRWFSWRYPS